MRRIGCVLVLATALGCGGGSAGPGPADTGQEASPPGEVAEASPAETAMDGTVEGRAEVQAEMDPGDPDPDDLSPEPGPEPLAEQGPELPIDASVDPAPDPNDAAAEAADPGAPEAWGPDTAGMSDNAAACVYVIAGICEKAIKKCDEGLLDLIPDNWLDTCTNFLLSNDETIKTACYGLDNAETTDETLKMIQQAGPGMLKQCIDNYECTFENIAGLVGVVSPYFQGKKPEVNDIIGLVVTMCF